MRKQSKLIAITGAMLLGLIPCLTACTREPTTPENNLPEFSIEEEYLPSTEHIGDYSGKIDVHLIFGSEMSGWKAVADAYETYQPNVKIVLQNYEASEYSYSLRNELNTESTDLDIFAGNYVNEIVGKKAYEFYDKLSARNPYAGNNVWKTVLEDKAYSMNLSSASSKLLYIMNSQSLETCWYVNREAFIDAGLVENGEVKIPKSWDELISFCATLQEKGYTNPLGLAGNRAAISQTQFAWLLRVYGDQYYRDLEDDIQSQSEDWCYSSALSGFELNLNAPQPEAEENWNPNVLRTYQMILDDESEVYAGVKSEKYACLMEQFKKIQPFVSSSFASKGFDDVRSDFLANRADKTSPVIFLDYLGFGLSFNGLIEDAGNRKFTIEQFDYPPMTCEEHVKTDYVRDVGGNGGYLSIFNHGTKQNELCLDFIQFFMSPYGQSVFYNALKEENAAPSGVTTVKKVDMPAEWKTYFENNKVRFNGLCDMNPFQRMYSHGGTSEFSFSFADSVSKYVMSSDASAFDTFAAEWSPELLKYFQTRFNASGYKLDCYKTPALNPKK